MSALYDRHEYIKDLTIAGLNEQQAEAIAKGAVSVQQSTLATKEDIGKLEKDIAKLEKDIVKLEASTKEDIAKLKADVSLLRWMVGFNLALTAATLLALIFK